MTKNKVLKAVGAAALAVVMSTSIALADTTFSDVPTNHWAYGALQQLQADGLIDGYPGGYFKGNRPLTRYELAVALYRAEKNVKDKLAAQQAVEAADIATLRKLLDEYKADLDGVKKDLATVKTDVATLKTQVAAQQAQLDRQKFKLYYFLRAPGTYKDYVSAYAANGNALPSGTLVIGPNNGAGEQTFKTGEFGQGTGYQVVRLRWDGVIDPKVSYSVRLENRYYLDNATGISNSGGLTGTSTTIPAAGGFPNNGLLRINWAYVGYKDPSGFYANVGRFAEQGGEIGLAFSDYFNGGEVGFAKGKVSGFAGYSFNKAAASLSQTAIYANSSASSQTWFASLQFAASKKFNVGANFIRDLAPYTPLTLQDPVTGFITPVNANIPIGSINLSYAFTPQFLVQAEAMQRFGKNPITHNDWDGKNAYWVKAYLGNTAPKAGNQYLDGGWINAGTNSTGPHNEVGGTPDYQQFYINNPNGYAIGYLGAHRFIGNNAQLGLVWQAWNLKNQLPVAAFVGGGLVQNSPFAYLQHDNGQALFVETKVSF
jgi:hypothetical protein